MRISPPILPNLACRIQRSFVRNETHLKSICKEGIETICVSVDAGGSKSVDGGFKKKKKHEKTGHICKARFRSLSQPTQEEPGYLAVKSFANEEAVCSLYPIQMAI